MTLASLGSLFTGPSSSCGTLNEDLTSLSLNFLLCKIEVAALSSQRVSRRIKLHNASNALTAGSGN